MIGGLMDLGALFVCALLVVLTAVFGAFAVGLFVVAVRSAREKEYGKAAAVSVFGLISGGFSAYFVYQLFSGSHDVGFRYFWDELMNNQFTMFALILGIALGIAVTAATVFIKNKLFG